MVSYQAYKPEEILRDYVRFFWSLHVDVRQMAQPFVHRALPDNCIELIFYCNGRLSISSSSGDEGYTFASGIYGQTQTHRQFRTSDDFSLFGVYLYPHVFPVLFNLPSGKLQNLKIDTATLWGKEGEILEERIMLATTDSFRVQLVSDFLLRRIVCIKEADHKFARHVKSLVDHNEVYSIDAMAHHCNLSRRQFERNFRRYSGLSPKDFFNLVRFKNGLVELQRGQSLAQAAIDAGYYDQSHFTNEFRKYSGYTPREYVLNHLPEVDLRATIDFRS